MNDLRMMRQSSVMWRHCGERHENREQDFKCNVRGVYGNDATMRKIIESVYIRGERAGINNKIEWEHTRMPRIIME